jgi:hypothetical protein
MKSSDQQLLEEAYSKVHSLRHFKALDSEVIDYISSLDGIEVDPDLDFEGQQTGYTSATASIDATEFPKTFAVLNDLVKQGKLKIVGGPATRDMSGRATTIK